MIVGRTHLANDYPGDGGNLVSVLTLPDIEGYGLQRFWIRIMWIVMKMTWADLKLLEKTMWNVTYWR